MNRSARAAVGRQHGPGRRTLPIIEAAYFCDRSSPARPRRCTSRTCGSCLCPALAPARARGDAARPAHAGHHRRRDPIRPARSPNDRAQGAAAPRLPVRRRRPARCSSTRGSRRSRPATPRARSRRPSTCSRSGHRRIGAITGPRGWLASSERLNGYHGALAAAGVCPTRDRCWSRGFQTDGGAYQAARLLDDADPPTAIFAFNDNIAIGVCGPRASAGCASREDLSVVGFDDSEHAAIVTPPLTTVRQPLAEMGRMAVMPAHPAARRTASRGAPHRAARPGSSACARRRASASPEPPSSPAVTPMGGNDPGHSQ